MIQIINILILLTVYETYSQKYSKQSERQNIFLNYTQKIHKINKINNVDIGQSLLKNDIKQENIKIQQIKQKNRKQIDWINIRQLQNIKQIKIQQECYLQAYLNSNTQHLYIKLINKTIQPYTQSNLIISLSNILQSKSNNQRQDNIIDFNTGIWLSVKPNICNVLNSNNDGKQIISTYNLDNHAVFLSLEQANNKGYYQDSENEINKWFALALFIVSCIILMFQIGYIVNLFIKKCRNRRVRPSQSVNKGSTTSSKIRSIVR